MQKPSIPKGTRDFGPLEMNRRNHIFDTITGIFRLYGYSQIETPAMELMQTLTGKYGDEGDKLLFRILNSGDFLSGVKPEDLASANSGSVAPQIAEKGLRYDLTVPFARFVVQNREKLNFPFKRYQVQPVWRADRPQKGRYREFYQCDVDVIGSRSLFYEAELIQIITRVFNQLGIPVDIHLNNRRILSGIASAIGCQDRFVSMTIAIDKLDKAGMEGVIKELENNGFSNENINLLLPFLSLTGGNDEKLNSLEELLEEQPEGMKGLAEIREIMQYLAWAGTEAPVVFDPRLARGLNYYTGAIFEVRAKGVSIGSICGGGRYDDLTGVFGMPGISGVGVSFGADRIYDVLGELNLFPEDAGTSTQVLILNFGGKETAYACQLLAKLREQGIAADFYPEPVALKKQFAWADRQKIPMVLMAGTNEIEQGLVNLKDMRSGNQESINEKDIIAFLNTSKGL